MDFDFLRRGAMLAPMAGVTDMPFRLICHEMGLPDGGQRDGERQGISAGP